MHGVLVHVYRAFGAVDRFRRNHKFWFTIICSVLTGLLTAGLQKFFQLTDYARSLSIVAFVAEVNGGWFWGPILGAALLAAVLEKIIGSIVFPLLAYVPSVMVHSELGFEAVTHRAPIAIKWMADAVERACRKPTGRVRVICIGGKYLWCSSPPTEKTPPPAAPLSRAAKEGRLDVIMPRLEADNPTVALRYKTYSNDYLLANTWTSVDDLIREMRVAREHLTKLHPTNTVREHDVLCMWRVLLTDDECIVQNYFPNTGGSDSFRAPAFKFRKVQNRTLDTYYDVFDKLFSLLQEPIPRQKQKAS